MRGASAIPAEALVPEADRHGEFPHPRETAVLFGHADAENSLLDAFRSGRQHHAWLLTGPDGVGKATLAYRFARFLLADGKAETLDMPADGTVFRRVAALAHPDLLVLRRPWRPKSKRHARAITVDEARRLRPFLGQTAAGKWRVVIIDRADDLNMAAVNALLKSVEEPPDRCVILLVSTAPGKIPVTVRSRCRQLRVGSLADDDLLRAAEAAFAGIGKEMPCGGEAETCLRLAEGSVKMALRLMKADGAALYARLLGLLGSLPNLDSVGAHKLSEEMSSPSAEETYELGFTLLEAMLSRMIRHAAAGTGALPEEAEIADRIIGPASLARWAGLWETVHRAKAETDALNLDRTGLVLETFFRLEETTRKAAA